MRVPHSGERKLTELDGIRLRRFTAAGAFPQLADILDDAQLVPPHASARLASGPGLQRRAGARRTS